MKRLALMAMLALAGCVNSQRTAEQMFPLYEGKSIETLIARWGAPRSVLSGSLGGPVYIWDGKSTMTTTTPVTSTGYVGTTPISITTPTTETISGTCRIEAHTDSQKRILGIRGNGPSGACTEWFNKLR